MARPLPTLNADARSPTPTSEPSSSGSEGRFTVEGLCCATEARQIEATLGRDARVTSLRIDPVRHTMELEGTISVADVERAIAKLGMKARAVDSVDTDARPRLARTRLALALASGIFWLAAVFASRWLESELTTFVLALGSVVAGGWYVFPRGLRAAANRALDMNFLMSTAAVGALLIGEYAEAASVMFLFAVAQLLETASMDRARNAIRSLMEMAPARATVLRDGREIQIAAESVRVGERVIVRPGEKVPVDGTIVAGRSTLDQAAITGESIPVAKEARDEVFSGTLNGEGVLEIRSTRAPADTTLARIIQTVEEARATRAPSQAFVDRFARVYTPAVVGVAAALAVAPPLLTGAAWGDWIYRALALLVVACPCALVISTPVTVVSALAGAARRGILIKGGLHLENAGRVRVVAFDKTGTLTEGRPEVASIVPFAGTDPRLVLALAAAVEAHSEHPLANAIRTRARGDGVEQLSAAHVRALPGRGAEGVVSEMRVLVGSERLFREEGKVGADTAAAIGRLEEGGRTVVLVGTKDGGGRGDPDLRVVGAIALADRIRPEAPAAVRALRDAGIRHIAILTGDNIRAASAVGSSLDPDAVVRAGLLPADKVSAIRELRASHGPVLMVGDGINDAPALAAADIGVAMGTAGTDVALETADIALMADDLSKLPTMIRLARKAERIIRWNIAFALLIKAVFVVLAVVGAATLWMAVLADMGASLLVIANGMRAREHAPIVAPPPTPATGSR
jgi:Cd2+/Zn2+-exporting ATPase